MPTTAFRWRRPLKARWRSHQQPAAHPRARGAVGQRHEQRLGPRSAGPGSRSSASRKSSASLRRPRSTARSSSTARSARRPFQVGANAGETISIGLNTSMKKDAIGQVAKAVGTVDITDLNGDDTARRPVVPAVDHRRRLHDRRGRRRRRAADRRLRDGAGPGRRINSKVSGASAWIDGDNHLVVASSEDLTIVQANDADTNLGLADATVAGDTDF